MTTSSSTTERAQQTAATAADEGRHVAGVAKDEAASVAAEAAGHARNLVGDAVGQLGNQMSEQTATQRDRLVGSLQTLGDDLERMATQGGASGLAADLAREVADRTHALSSRLDGREPAELLDDARQFARSRPGIFLFGALAAGVVAGRVLRGAQQAKQQQSSTTPTTTPTTGTMATGTTSPPRPVSTPGQPTVEPTTYGSAGTPLTTPPTQSSFADQAPTATFDTDAPMGTPAAGYGERGTLGEERP